MKNSKSKQFPPVFIIGAERSGTTLLRLILTSHSLISIPPESKFIEFLFSEFAEQKQIDTTQFLNKLFQEPFFKFWKFEKQELRKALSQVKEKNFKNLVSEIYKLYAKREKKEIWGDKNPGYTLNPKMLLDLFPDGKFIHIVRDGRDTVLSLTETAWGEKNVEKGAQKWVDFVTSGNRFARIYPENAIEIKYEDLVKTPEKIIRECCKFLGINFEKEMLKFYEQNQEKELVPAEQKEFHQNTFKKITNERIGRWGKIFNISEQLQIQAVEVFALSDNGYELYLKGVEDSNKKFNFYLKLNQQYQARNLSQRIEGHMRDINIHLKFISNTVPEIVSRLDIVLQNQESQKEILKDLTNSTPIGILKRILRRGK